MRTNSTNTSTVNCIGQHNIRVNTVHIYTVYNFAPFRPLPIGAELNHFPLHASLA